MVNSLGIIVYLENTPHKSLCISVVCGGSIPNYLYVSNRFGRNLAPHHTNVLSPCKVESGK